MAVSERHKDARPSPTSPLVRTLCERRPDGRPSRSRLEFQQRWRPKGRARWMLRPTSAPAPPGDRILSARRRRRCRYREDTSKINVARERSVPIWDVAFLQRRRSEQAAKAWNVRQASPSLPGNDHGLLAPVSRDRERLAVQRLIDNRGERRLRVFELNFPHSRAKNMTTLVILTLASALSSRPLAHSIAVPFASSTAPAR